MRTPDHRHRAAPAARATGAVPRLAALLACALAGVAGAGVGVRAADHGPVPTRGQELAALTGQAVGGALGGLVEGVGGPGGQVAPVVAAGATVVVDASLGLLVDGVAAGRSPGVSTASGGGGDGAAVRLSPAVTPAGVSGSHSFLLEDAAGEPVRWDPCRPIPVVMREQGAPAGARDLLTEVLADASAATGLVLYLEGTTDEAPLPDRSGEQPDRYGAEWAPVLVAWSDAGEYPPLGGDRIGVTTPVAVDPPGWSPMRYVTGSVVLESDWFASAVTSGGSARARGVLRHEIAHLVGLDHVEDPSELMNPVYRDLPDWGPGDRVGLALAGAGPCLDASRP